jgi:hypothetical protein
MPRPPRGLPGIGAAPVGLAGGAAPFLGIPARGEDSLGLDPEIVAQIQEDMEQRWLDESVPALGGVTPRQAADDPTRRDDLIRLIDGFPEPEPGSAVFSFRPDRLRKLLGLPRH